MADQPRDRRSRSEAAGGDVKVVHYLDSATEVRGVERSFTKRCGDWRVDLTRPLAHLVTDEARIKPHADG